MSPKQGWFESDDDYRKRVARKADERTTEESTGSAPSRGWFESDESYDERIAREANEHRIEDAAGSAPSRGWFESDESYDERIAREANERTIEDAAGSAPSRGWFESDDDYETRIRKEANEIIVTGGTGLSPKQGWFEGDHEYRSRIAHEAREVRARERSNSSSGSNSGSSFEAKRGNWKPLFATVGCIAIATLVMLVSSHQKVYRFFFGKRWATQLVEKGDRLDLGDGKFRLLVGKELAYRILVPGDIICLKADKPYTQILADQWGRKVLQHHLAGARTLFGSTEVVGVTLKGEMPDTTIEIQNGWCPSRR